MNSENKIVKSIDDFLLLKGEKLGVSDWMVIDQSRINLFDDATIDYQWIHVDEQRAKEESIYHATIVPGYLTLSLAVHLLESAFNVQNVKQIINYSVEKMIFKKPVVVNSRVRLHVYLDSAKDLGNICQAKLHCQMEIEHQDEPAFDGIITFLYFFKRITNANQQLKIR